MVRGEGGGVWPPLTNYVYAPQLLLYDDVQFHYRSTVSQIIWTQSKKILNLQYNLKTMINLINFTKSCPLDKSNTFIENAVWALFWLNTKVLHLSITGTTLDHDFKKSSYYKYFQRDTVFITTDSLKVSVTIVYFILFK